MLRETPLYLRLNPADDVVIACRELEAGTNLLKENVVVRAPLRHGNREHRRTAKRHDRVMPDIPVIDDTLPTASDEGAQRIKVGRAIEMRSAHRHEILAARQWTEELGRVWMPLHHLDQQW